MYHIYIRDHGLEWQWYEVVTGEARARERVAELERELPGVEVCYASAAVVAQEARAHESVLW